MKDDERTVHLCVGGSEHPIDIVQGQRIVHSQPITINVKTSAPRRSVTVCAPHEESSESSSENNTGKNIVCHILTFEKDESTPTTNELLEMSKFQRNDIFTIGFFADTRRRRRNANGEPLGKKKPESELTIDTEEDGNMTFKFQITKTSKHRAQTSNYKNYVIFIIGNGRAVIECSIGAAGAQHALTTQPRFEIDAQEAFEEDSLPVAKNEATPKQSQKRAQTESVQQLQRPCAVVTKQKLYPHFLVTSETPVIGETPQQRAERVLTPEIRALCMMIALRQENGCTPLPVKKEEKREDSEESDDEDSESESSSEDADYVPKKRKKQRKNARK